MTDYYKHLREKLFTEGWEMVISFKMPEELEAMIYEAIDKKGMKDAYCEMKLTEQYWAELEQVCRVYESPLMKALA